MDFEGQNENGNPVPARVTLSNEDREACYPADGATTDEFGSARLICDYGTYSLKVTSPVFKEYTEEDYEVNKGAQTKIIMLSRKDDTAQLIVGPSRHMSSK